MQTKWQTQRDELVLTLARVRSALQGVQAEAQRAADRHERMAAWYAQQGDETAAWMERRTAEVQRQVLVELNGAFQGLETAVSAVSDLDP
jgi:TPP-dependent trihydroxycyclohexane-1,2-dione (THcHDO) dehydratase